MKQAVTFGSVVFSDDAICTKGRDPISNKDIIKICHGNVAQYVNGVPIIQTFKIKIHLSSGQGVVAQEEVDIRPIGKNKKMNRIEDTKSRFMASLTLLSGATGLKPQSFVLGVDNFLAGAWSKHKKRLVDLIWLFIFGIPLALVLIISRRQVFFDDVPNLVIYLFPIVLFVCGYMSLRKLAHFLSDR